MRPSLLFKEVEKTMTPQPSPRGMFAEKSFASDEKKVKGFSLITK